MGCIETSCCMRLQLRWLINFNMGCIETDEPTQIKVKPNR